MTTAELKSKLTKSLDFLKTELSQIRTGRATPSLIEDIVVDAYGTEMTVKELGSIIVQDPHNIVVTPWDKTLLDAISKAIRESEQKLNPVEESDKLRVPIPSLTEERRTEFTKIVSTKVEEAKSSMRNIRQDAMKDVDKAYANKDIGEDEKFTQREEIDEMSKEYVTEAEDLGDKKKQDLMTV